MKKDRSVKIALVARALNQAIDKDKYQMPNLDNLLDMVAEKLDNEEGEAWYSSVDMTYAYGQIPLHLLTAKHKFSNYRRRIDGDVSVCNRFLWSDGYADKISKSNGLVISKI